MNIRSILNMGATLLLTQCSLSTTLVSPTPEFTSVIYTPVPTITLLPTTTIAPSPTANPTQIPAASTSIPSPAITDMSTEYWLNRMTVAQKVGQLMLVGIRGTSVTSETRQILTELHIGGVVLLENNISNPQGVTNLTNELQTIAQTGTQPGLFIAIDQEGGLVIRLRQSHGFTELPSPMAIAATGNLSNATAIASIMVTELKAVGINMNLAPGLDVNNNPANPIIGSRSFGSDPTKVAAFGTALLKGLQSNGIISIGKHFPGHGDTNLDSHLALPVIAHTKARLDAVELLPFRAAIDANIAGIMSAHIVFPAVEPTPNLPATLSANILGKLLRKDLNFKGLIMTDALDMQALNQAGYSTPAASIAALNAGADILLFAQGIEGYRQSHTALMNAVRSGNISMNRLNDAVRRILNTKIQFKIITTQPLNANLATSRVNIEAHQQQVIAIAQAAITQVRDHAQLIPLPKNKPILVIEVPSAYGLANRLGAKVVRINASPTTDEIQMILRASPGNILVLTTHNAHLYPGQVNLVKSLQQTGLPFVVAALGVPYDILQFNNIPSYIVSYSSSTQSAQIALAKVLLGEVSAMGQLPVQIPGITP